MDQENKGLFEGQVLKLACFEDFSSLESDSALCYRLVYIESGTAILRLNQQNDVVSGPVLVCLGENDTLHIENSSQLKLSVFYFHPEIVNQRFTYENLRINPRPFKDAACQDATLLRPFFERTTTYTGIMGIRPNQAERVSSLVALTKKELTDRRDFYWPCRSRSHFFELLFILQNILFDWNQSESSLGRYCFEERKQPIQELILFLHDRYPEKITLPLLCKTFNMNRTTLENRFLKATGTPVITYLINIRLKIASMLLRDTQLPVSEVLERVGFSDRTHFSRIFKKVIGVSPKTYRQMH